MRNTVLVTIFAAAALAGCQKQNSGFCEGPADCPDIDAPPVSCTTEGPDLMCPADRPVCMSGQCGACDGDNDCANRSGLGACLLPGGACVECNEMDVQSNDCPAAAMAVCDGASHTCRACQDDNECSEGVCDNGRCATEAEVVYMSPEGMGNACTKAEPCKDLKIALGLATAAKRFVSMAPGAYMNLRTDVPTVDRTGFEFVVAGRGSTLQREAGMTAEMFKAASNARVQVRDLTIDGVNSDGDGVVCTGANTLVDLRRVTIQNVDGSGVNSDCRLLIADSHILNVTGAGIDLSNANAVLRLQRTRVIGSGGAGLSVSQASSIVVANSVFAGSASAQVSLTQVTDIPNSYFGLNTVANGQSDGVTCATGAQVPLSNSIISGNSGNATNCTVVAFTLGVATSVPMIAGDPMLTADYHIQPGSAAQGAADPAAQLLPLDGVERNLDIDGEPRVNAGLDVGADEIQ